MIRDHSRRRNLALPFPVIHEQPLTVPHYFEISYIDFSLASFPKSRALELCTKSSLVLWPDRWDDSYGRPFEDFINPYTIFWHSPISIRNPLCEMEVNFNGKHTSHVKSESHYKFPVGKKLPALILTNTTWLTLSCAIWACNSYSKC
jgi:hypothetical protein